MLPFSYPDRVSPDDDVAQMPQRKNIGGIARRATLVKQIKAREKNVFLFDGGDCMDGTPFSTEFFGKADYDAMNGVGYDFAVPGNHDFNMTAQQFRELADLVKFPYLLANLYDKNGTDEQRPLAPYKIANWDGLRVAVLGLTTYSTRTYKAAAEAYRLRDPLDVAREMVPLLRKQADLVVIVAHVGHEIEWQIAREVPGVDVIVGAHSHKRFSHGVYVAANAPGPADPPGTVYVQAHQWGGELGRLDLTVAEQPGGRWRVTRYGAQLLPITDRYAPDPLVARTVARYWDRIKNKYGVVVGRATGEFTEARGQDYTNYYLVADAVQQMTGAQFDLENRSGVRGPLLAGPVTTGDIIGVDPFDNTLITYKIKGADLKRILARSRPSTSASLRYEVRYDAGARSGNGTDAAGSVWRLAAATIDGKPIEDAAVYSGATNSYFFERNVKPVAIEFQDTKRLRRDALTEYVRKNSPISPRPDGRNKFVGADPFARE